MNKFSKVELVSIYKAADLMVLADDKILEEETATVEEAMAKAGVESPTELEDIKKGAKDLSRDECIGYIAFLDYEQKRFVSSMLGAICSSDGDIDDRELELWRELCDKCDLPYMNNRQAINIFQTF